MRTSSRAYAVLFAAGALLVASALAGCPKKKPKGTACASEADCKDGAICVNKQCQQCAQDADCPTGKECTDGACVAKPECSQDGDCTGGKVCEANKCVACKGDNECGPGGKCNAGACERPRACSADDDCAEDEDCIDGHCQKPWTSTVDPNTCSLATIYFALDDASIAGSERDHLDANHDCMDKNPTKNVYLIGHTDESGTDEYNIALSERRARAVADYLARLGSDPARLQVVPKGKTEPTGLGDDKDRRVEFQWH